MAKRAKRPTIELWAFWELSKKEQAAVRRWFQGLTESREFEEYNYTRTDDGIVDWLDIKSIPVDDD